MVIGRLNKKCMFYEAVELPDNFGQLQKDWKLVFTLMGGTTDIKAKERFITDRQLRHHITKLYLRYDDRIDTKMRVLIKDKFWYHITGYALLDNDRALELVLEEIEKNDVFDG